MPIAFAILLFLPMLRNGFVADDFTWLDRTIDTLARPGLLFSFPEKDFRPFASFLWLVNLWFAGVAPIGYDLVNLLLHALNVALVHRLALRVGGGRRDLAFVTAALFAATFGSYGLAVGWISARTGLLADGLVLATLLLHARWIERGRAFDRAASLVTFALALLSKESAVVLPLVLLAIEWVTLGTWREVVAPARLRRWMPHLLLLAAYLGYQFLVFRRGSPVLGRTYALGPHVASHFGEYLVRMAIPLDATSTMLPLPVTLRTVLAVCEGILGAALPVAWAALAWRRRERWVRFGVAWMFVMLLPYLGFTWRTDTRYLYGPSIGFCLLAGGAIATWREQLADRRRLRWLPVTVLAALLALSGGVVEFVLATQYRYAQRAPAEARAELAHRLAVHPRAADVRRPEPR